VDKHELLAMISVAERNLSEAETDLDQAIGEIRIALRAEKTAVTSTVEDAFAKLQRAKRILTELEARLSSAPE
jgi:hypothetical protein